MSPQEVVHGTYMYFYKAAPVPYAMKSKIDKTLDDLMKKGIIEPVKFADYACPVVAVNKPDGGVKICSSYKLTANGQFHGNINL